MERIETTRSNASPTGAPTPLVGWTPSAAPTRPNPVAPKWADDDGQRHRRLEARAFGTAE
jgi:hypothetical protein